MPVMFDGIERAELATLPTALERGPLVGRNVRLWVKRDDLTGLGGGGNKARKLEFLCGDALATGARSLVTAGAGQSNHCRMSAAAGARLGLETHLVLSGDPPPESYGNQLLATLFGAQLHFTGAAESHWGELEIAREALTEALVDEGAAPYSVGVGGTSPIGALGYAAAYLELMAQCDAAGLQPAAVVFTSSSGGTHAGLLAGQVLRRQVSTSAPPLVAVGVAKGVNIGLPDVAELAEAALERIGTTTTVDRADVEIDTRWMGTDYAIPTEAGDEAVTWAAREGGWLMDRTYSGKGLAGMLGMINEDRFDAGSDVVFIHTGGWPALFAPEGTPTATRMPHTP